jgi:hypothetical protein
MQYEDEINSLPKDDELAIQGAINNDQESLEKVLVLLCENSTFKVQKAIRAYFDRAYQAEQNNPHYLFLQGLAQQYGIDDFPDYIQAAAFYRKAMIHKNGESFCKIADMIMYAQYSPGTEDFAAAGITDPGGTNFEQAATFYRKAMIHKNGQSFYNMGEMIENGFYSPGTEDFDAAGIIDLGGNLYQKAAAFYRQGMIHKISESFCNIADMIASDEYSPGTEDFAAAGITDPGGNRFQQAAAIFYQMYLCFPAKRTDALAKLNEIIERSTERNSYTHLTLLRLYLLHENDLENATRCLELHPDKNKALEILMAEVVKQLDDPKFDHERAQRLLDFVIDQGAEELNPLTIKYVELKVLLIEGEDVKALDFYRQNIPTDFILTSQEYFRLGSVVIGSILGTMSNEQKDQLRHEGLNLLYKSYQQNNLDQNDAKRLILKMLLETGGVKIDCVSKEAELKFQEFLADIAKQEGSKSEEIKIQLSKLEDVRARRSKQLDSTSSGAMSSSSFFPQNKELIIPPELVFLDRGTTEVSPCLRGPYHLESLDPAADVKNRYKQ